MYMYREKESEKCIECEKSIKLKSEITCRYTSPMFVALPPYIGLY